MARPETLDLIRKEFEPESPAIASPLRTLLVSVRAKGVVGADAVELDVPPGVRDSMDEILPWRARSAGGFIVAAFDSGARTVAGRSCGCNLEGDAGRIFAGEGDRRAVTPTTCGRSAPLTFELGFVLSLVVFEVRPYEVVLDRAVLLIFARTMS